MTWLLTREGADSSALLEALRQRGVDALVLPCIERRLRSWPQVKADWVMLTSRKAAAELPEETRAAIACLAPRTAEVVRARGLEPRVTATGGAVGLARALVPLVQPGERVLYVHSDLAEGRCEHRDAMAILGDVADVESHVLYEILKPAALHEQWSGLADRAYSLLFASPSAVENWWSEQQASARRIVRVACLGASTVAAYLAVSANHGLPAPTRLTAGEDLAAALAALS